MPRFSESSIHDLGDGSFWFECSMCSSVPSHFGDLDDNYAVEDRLRKAKVILSRNQTDSETCALVVNFSSRVAGQSFLSRLNRYIEETPPLKEVQRPW